MPNHLTTAHAFRAFAAAVLLVAGTACGESKEHKLEDSINAAAAAEQAVLARQLAAQKDSLVAVVLDADQFISQIDSQVSRVKGLPKRDKGKAKAEGVLQEQLEARQDMLFKVDALVKRAQATARQLADAQRREAGLRTANGQLTDSLAKTEAMIVQLGETIQRQTAQITELQTSVTQLAEANTRLTDELRVTLASNSRVYYIIGREDELLKKGVIVKEGGMNLLLGRVGETVHPSRTLDPAVFTSIDAREVQRIAMPDSTKRYRIVSRQSLDDAEVTKRDKSWFTGSNLNITNVNKFWSPSRYLIVVQG